MGEKQTRGFLGCCGTGTAEQWILVIIVDISDSVPKEGMGNFVVQILLSASHSP